MAARLIAEPPADALHALDDAKLAAPILPSTILCAGSNYREHNDKSRLADERQGARVLCQNLGQRDRPGREYPLR